MAPISMEKHEALRDQYTNLVKKQPFQSFNPNKTSRMKFPVTVQLVNTICHCVIEERVDQNFIPPRAALHSQVPN